MVANYLRVAVRMLARQRLYTALNIVGLALGIATAAMMALFIWHETHFDGFFSHSDRIYRVLRVQYVPGRAPDRDAVTAKPLAPALIQDLPEVETAVRVVGHRIVLRDGATPVEDTIRLVDPDFFRLFDFPFLAGDPATALVRPGTVVLTATQARKYFGTTDVLGRTLTLTSGVGLTVTGVLRDLPSNSTFSRDLKVTMLTRIDTKFRDGWDEWFTDSDQKWRNDFLLTFVLLKPGADPAVLVPRFPGFLAAHVDNYQLGGPALSTMELQPLARIHTDPVGGRGVPAAVLAALAGVAGVVLAIAVVNFVNLSTARSSLRAREVAVRKTLGGRRAQVMAQFLVESVLLAVVSGLMALVLVELAMPRFLAVMDMRMDADFLSNTWMAAVALPIVLAVGLLGGLYPAIVLSRPRPADLLRDGPAAGGGRLRAALVVGQSAAAIVLCIATVVIGQQTRYASTQRLGFRADGVVVLRGLDRPAGKVGLDTLRDAVLRIPGVVAAGASANVPSDGSEWASNYRLPGTPSGPMDLNIRTEPVDFDYLTTLGVRRLAGRGFDRAHPAEAITQADLAAGGGRADIPAILSKAAVTALGLGTPEAAVGRTVIYGDSTRLTVIGVVDDVQFDSARAPVQPTVYLVMPAKRAVLSVRLSAGSGPATLAAIDDLWRRLFPDLPLRREFLDDHIRQVYAAEARQAELLAFFSGLAIAIACLGLFGLAAFTAERRTKEIGLRKVLGAGVIDIVRLLVWQFSKPVLLANLVAWPVAWGLMAHWLGGFAYRVPLSPLVFAATGLAALVIAWVTVAGHAARVAAAKPVNALRYE